jgi:hypothetical protein
MGRSTVKPVSSSRENSRVMRRGACRRSSSPYRWARVRALQAICRPSGDHRRSATSSSNPATVTTSPPANAGATRIVVLAGPLPRRSASCPSPAPRLDVNASRPPSGDQAGLAS